MFLYGCNPCDAGEFQSKLADAHRAPVTPEEVMALCRRRQIVSLARTEESPLVQLAQDRYGIRVPQVEPEFVKRSTIQGMIILVAKELPARSIREGERCSDQELKASILSFEKYDKRRRA